MTVTANFHDPQTAESRTLGNGNRNNALGFNGKDGEYVTLFVPPHVADATAAAFNRAMQAVPTYQRGGYQYTTERQIWFITNDHGWHAQSDEITGDGDPSWLFADAPSLMALLDEIDAQEADNGCGRCASMPGLDNLHEIGRGKDMEMICADCLTEEGKRQEEMHEAAMDDKAHAMAERRAGL